MAIVFYQKKRRQIYSGLMAIILVVVLVFVWFKFLRNKDILSNIPSINSLEYREKRIQVDFGKLESELIKNLEPFAPIVSPGENLGRDNPFAPYAGTTTTSTIATPPY
jgi:hypothetical protein